MKIWKVTYTSDHGGCEGYSYHRFSDWAIKAAQDYNANVTRPVKTSIEPFDIPVTSAGLLAALNHHGGHADNG